MNPEFYFSKGKYCFWLFVQFFFLIVCIISNKKVFGQKLSLTASSLIMQAGQQTGFLENYGQIKDRENRTVKNIFYTYHNSSSAGVYITNKGISYVFKNLKHRGKKEIAHRSSYSRSNNPRDSSNYYSYEIERVDVNLLNATIDTSEVQIEEKNGTFYNYYDGRVSVKGSRSIKKIIFKNVYPGIDWVLYEVNDEGKIRVKYDFVVHQGANAALIKIKYSENAVVVLEKDGSLSVKSRLGFIREGTPVVSMSDEGNSFDIKYIVSNNVIRYETGPHTAKSYTIDPDLVWGTFLRSVTPYDGMTWGDVTGTDIETDQQGNIYVALNCDGSIDFPVKNPGGGAYFDNVHIFNGFLGIEMR